MDRLISEFEVIRAIEKYVDNIFTKNMGDLINDIKAISSAEPYKGMTNGEVIESLFPNVGINFSNVLDLNLWWKAEYKNKSVIHCNCTDAEIAKSFIEDVKAVEHFLPRAESKE